MGTSYVVNCGCCGSGGGGCCGMAGHTLLATISDKTGDCTCLPDEVTLPDITIPPNDPEWSEAYSECGGCAVTLYCHPGDAWELQPASCAASVTLVSANCDPFELVFAVDNTGGAATNCSGTYTVTITEAP